VHVAVLAAIGCPPFVNWAFADQCPASGTCHTSFTALGGLKQCSAVNCLHESSGSRSDSTPPNIHPPLPSTAGESLGPGHVSSPLLHIQPRLTPNHQVVAEVQTSPCPIDMPMIVDNPWSAIGVQTSAPISPVRLAQGMQTVFDNILIPLL
jgi:hypothetical protein